jgi:Leucine-rich repeat (LRR) protein
MGSLNRIIMKRFIIVAIVFGLVSNSGLAMKREREEGPETESENKESRIEQAPEGGAEAKQSRIKQNAQVFQLLEQQLRSNTDPLSQEMVLLNISNDEIVRGIDFINSNNFQNQYPVTLAAFNNRVFVQCNDGQIRHFYKIILNGMVTLKNLLDDRVGPVTLAEPLPIPNMPMKEFMILYQITANCLAQPRTPSFARLSNDAKIQTLLASIRTILHRNNFKATDLLVPAFYLSLPDLALDALARETAIEIKKYINAFPALSQIEPVPGAPVPGKEPGVVYTEFLPDNVKALSKDILASVMRQFFLINPKETQPRLVSQCYHQDDIFCLKTLQFDLPMKPFSITELLQYKKINIKNHTFDLRRMNINDLTGFENIPGLNQVGAVLLDNNKLRELPANFLNNCPLLLNLQLQLNQLQQLPANFLNNCPQFRNLDLSHNQLQQLPANFLNNCPQLQKLRLHKNQLQQLPGNFLNNAPQLLELSLNENQFQELPARFLNNCLLLQALHLNKNQLQQLPEKFLDNAPQLQKLTLNENQLRELPANFLNNCPQLQALVLQNNQLRDLPENFLNNCPQLKTLMLQNNQLRELPENFLNNCPQLKILRFEQNQLSSETIEQIKENLLRQGKVVDGKNIILEPQNMKSKPK